MFVQSVTTRVRRRLPTRYRARSTAGNQEDGDVFTLECGRSVIEALVVRRAGRPCMRRL
jgi:hypothetical protein